MCVHALYHSVEGVSTQEIAVHLTWDNLRHYGDNNETPTIPATWLVQHHFLAHLAARQRAMRSKWCYGDNDALTRVFWQSLFASSADRPASPAGWRVSHSVRSTGWTHGRAVP